MSLTMARMVVFWLVCAFLTLAGCAAKTTHVEESANSPSTSKMPVGQNISQIVPTEPPPKPDMVCSRNVDHRSVEVIEVDSGCWVMYTSGGIKKRVAWSKKGNTFCEGIRDQIRRNLETAKFHCQWQQ